MALTKIDALREAYFHWLVSQVKVDGVRTYWDLLRIMHETEFVWLISKDDNRIEDGTDLRLEFRDGSRMPNLTKEHFGPCSVLEVLIALSRRLEHNGGGEADEWAYQLIVNLRLQNAYDPLTRGKANRVHRILNNLIFRTYNPDGSGGFFPLQNPPEDQTRVEIWYQMAAYILEVRPDF